MKENSTHPHAALYWDYQFYNIPPSQLTYCVLNCFLPVQKYLSTFSHLAQIRPGHSSFWVDPHSFVVIMVQYLVFFYTSSSSIGAHCASAAVCNIGNSRLISKLITFVYQEADTQADTLPEVHWGCCLSKLSVYIARFFFFVWLQHDMTTGLCLCAGGWGLASRCAVAAPWLAPVCCSSVCNDSRYQFV